MPANVQRRTSVCRASGRDNMRKNESDGFGTADNDSFKFSISGSVSDSARAGITFQIIAFRYLIFDSLKSASLNGLSRREHCASGVIGRKIAIKLCISLSR